MFVIRRHFRQRIQKQLMNGFSPKLLGSALQQLLGGGIAQRDVAIEPGGNESSADGLNNVLVQSLQIFQRSAGVFELYVHLAQLCRQQASQIGHGGIAEQVDKNYGLQPAPAGVGSRKRRDHAEIGQLENCPIQDESQSSG